MSESGTVAHRPRTAVAAAGAAVGTVVAIVGIAVAVFFNPFWIGFEQARTGVPEITGYSAAEVQDVTGSILEDLFLGPAAFDVAVQGQPVLGAAERSHMVDVRNVLVPATIAFVAAVSALAVLVAANRRSAWLWGAIGFASRGLGVLGIVIAATILLLFDAAWGLFHLVFFPQGNFSFDPRTQRLTQLFPEQFWIETSIGVAIVGLTLALGLSFIAHRAARRRA